MENFPNTEKNHSWINLLWEIMFAFIFHPLLPLLSAMCVMLFRDLVSYFLCGYELPEVLPQLLAHAQSTGGAPKIWLYWI